MIQLFTPPLSQNHFSFNLSSHFLEKETTKLIEKAAMGVAQVNQIWFHIMIILFSISISLIAASEDDCVYTAYIRTGSIIKAGTDSNISLTLYDADGYGLRIKNLEAWGGLMGPGYNYFERGNLDIFSGRGPCLNGPICKMNLTSDGTGPHHGWYCNYVEITVTGPHKQCNQQLFNVEQWLGTDVSPYQLTAIRDNCNKSKSKSGEQQPLYHSESYPMVDVI